MLSIQKLFIKYNYSTRREKIKYIVLHDVGTVSTARNNRDYFNSMYIGASADFFVDNKNVIQLIDYNTSYSWAVGDGRGKYGITNSNSISIEMCLESNLEPSVATVNNTLDLVKKLMKELNISSRNVIRHYDASRKLCPQSFSKNNWAKWNEFKSNLTIERKIDNMSTLDLQKFLNNLNITDYDNRKLVEDGIIGKRTNSAKEKAKEILKSILA